MTPKEKAFEIVSNQFNILAKASGHKSFVLSEEKKFVVIENLAKQFALTAIDLKIEDLPSINNTPPVKRLDDKFYLQYWNIVKQEIEKL